MQTISQTYDRDTDQPKMEGTAEEMATGNSQEMSRAVSTNKLKQAKEEEEQKILTRIFESHGRNNFDIEGFSADVINGCVPGSKRGSLGLVLAAPTR